MVYQGTLGSPVRRSQRLAGRQTPVGIKVSTGGVYGLCIMLWVGVGVVWGRVIHRSIQGNSRFKF